MDQTLFCLVSNDYSSSGQKVIQILLRPLWSVFPDAVLSGVEGVT